MNVNPAPTMITVANAQTMLFVITPTMAPIPSPAVTVGRMINRAKA